MHSGFNLNPSASDYKKNINKSMKETFQFFTVKKNLYSLKSLIIIRCCKGIYPFVNLYLMNNTHIYTSMLGRLRN